MSKVPQLIIQGVVLLVTTSVSGWAMAQECAVGTTVTIDPYLSNYNKAQQSAVAYAWTRAHYDSSTGQWGDKSNPNETISSTTGGAVATSGPFASNYDAPHPGQFDSANAGASAQCAGANCSSPTLITTACVTGKVDSAAAGAYARAGIIAKPQNAGDKRGTATITIPQRMTLTGNVGDETGVWGIVVSVEEGRKPAVDYTKDEKAPLDVHPWLAALLGLNTKEFKVQFAKNRDTMFAVGFQLDPRAKAVKLIGPTGKSLKTLTPDQQASLTSLLPKFKVEPCKDEKTGKSNKKCRVASYELPKNQEIKVEVPIAWEKSGENMIYFEVGHGGREDLGKTPKK